MNKIHIVVFCVLLLLASVTRLYRLDSVPPSPYWEEVALGYDAYSIAKTGKDHHGNSYPVIAFPSYGDYKPSGYFYAIVPFVHILGLNLWSIRLPSAIAGIGSVVLLFFISKKLTTKKIAFIVMALSAISPWNLQFSRAGFEVNLAVFFCLLGTYLVLKSITHYWYLPLAAVAFVIAMYTYHAARVFAPVVGGLEGVALLAFWLSRNKKDYTKWLLPVVTALFSAVLLILPFVFQIHNEAVSSRFSQTSIFTDSVPILKSNNQIAAHGGTRVAKIVYHRYWYFLYEIAANMLSFVSPEFLFWKGDGNLRHSVTKYGLLYPFEAIGIIIAILSIFFVENKEKHSQRTIIVISLLWVLCATIAPSLVTPTPHALRFLFASPALTLLTGIGISRLLLILPKRFAHIGSLVVAMIFIYSFSQYIQWYYTFYPIKSARDWQYGYKQLYETLEKNKKTDEQVFVTREQGRPSMFYLYYTGYDPKTIQKSGLQYPKDQLELLQVDSYHFIDADPNVSGLYASSPEKKPAALETIATITAPDGSTIWSLWRRE